MSLNNIFGDLQFGNLLPDVATHLKACRMVQSMCCSMSRASRPSTANVQRPARGALAGTGSLAGLMRMRY